LFRSCDHRSRDLSGALLNFASGKKFATFPNDNGSCCRSRQPYNIRNVRVLLVVFSCVYVTPKHSGVKGAKTYCFDFSLKLKRFDRKIYLSCHGFILFDADHVDCWASAAEPSQDAPSRFQ
jgi:hypothetical protein